MKRGLLAAYGLSAYAIFLGAFAVFIGFIENLGLPRSIDVGPDTPPLAAAALDVGLVALFGVQHSVMARAGFKRAFARLVPEAAQRSTFVLVSSLLLLLIAAAWRPIPAVLAAAPGPAWRAALMAFSLFGVALVLAASFLIDHWEFAGLRQSLGLAPRPDEFRASSIYRWVRHPLYLGLLIAFWSAPVYTVGRVLFAGSMTVYILAGATLEERDLLRHFGETYAIYRKRVAMLIPFLR